MILQLLTCASPPQARLRSSRHPGWLMLQHSSSRGCVMGTEVELTAQLWVQQVQCRLLLLQVVVGS
jgi:hypothetical protein